jgi:hypothetical protein
MIVYPSVSATCACKYVWLTESIFLDLLHRKTVLPYHTLCHTVYQYSQTLMGQLFNLKKNTRVQNVSEHFLFAVQLLPRDFGL